MFEDDGVLRCVCVTVVTVRLSSRDVAAMTYVWGQFLDHDLSITITNPNEPFNVAVPSGVCVCWRCESMVPVMNVYFMLSQSL